MELTARRSACVALVDNDVHSARLLMRTLTQEGIGPARWLGSARRSLRLLNYDLPLKAKWPSMLVVNIPAGAQFVTAIGHLARKHDAQIVALIEPERPDLREGLLKAGAARVFERQPDRDAYRARIAALGEYWKQR